MRAVIDSYAEGIFDINNDKLDFSVYRLEASTPQGELYEGSFDLFSIHETEFHAYIYTSHMRLIVRNDEVKGSRETIHYVFDATGLEPGDVIKGDVQIVSDIGEYYLPFAFSISFGVIKSSLGTVRNLFHFANQAQLNYGEAVDLFYSEAFAQVFDGNDRVHRGRYRGFSAKKGDYQAVDDFLVSVNKKRPVTLSVDKSTFEFNEVTDLLRCDVQLHKSTWGNVDVNLSADAPFIMLEKDHLSSSDFVGNTHNLVFFVMDDKLHEGRNYARITISCTSGDITLTIIARHRQRVNAIRIERREKRNLNAQLIGKYIDFRMKKINVTAWVRESMKIVERMNALDEKNPVSRLYQAQLLLTQRRDNEAKWILDHVEREMSIANHPDEEYAYYLYLKSLLERNESITDEIAEKVNQMFANNSKSMPILWTLLYIDGELSVAGPKRIEAIERMYSLGNRSPILYVEAYNYFAQNPVRLTKLTEFELQVLYFAVKNGRLDEELSNQMVYLASRNKSLSGILYKLLKAAYKMHPSTDIVEVVCTLLIKTGQTNVEYFVWFERGIEAQLRITRLYEYYMYTLPHDYSGVIPKQVLMYFNFGNQMDWRHMGQLYANIIDNRKHNPDSFEAYKENMQVYVMEQVESENIDSNVAKIVENVIDIDMVRPSMAGYMAKILFACEVKIPDISIVKVILIQDQFVGEQEYPIDRGKAYPLIYSNNSILFYEDSKGRRTQVPDENVKKLLNEGVYLPAIRNYVANNVYFSLYLCEGRKHYITVDDRNVEFCRELADSNEVSENYKREIRMALMHYYYDNDQISTMDDFLIHMNIKVLSERDRAEVVQFYVLRGMYDQAYQIVSIYGCEEVSPNICVRICNHMIGQKDFMPDSMLIRLCYHAFKLGKYDEVTLNYLINHYAGLTKELRNLWRAAREFEVEHFSLTERLIVQMLFSHISVGEKEEIFEEYLDSGSSTRVELAYLSYCAYEYFVKERLTDERVFSHIIHNYRLDEPINDACRLALLKYYAEEQPKYSQKVANMLKTFLLDFLHRNIYFRFFESYQDTVPELLEYSDKTVIEYRTAPDSRVILHYILSDETKDEDEYHTEEMRNLFGGIFSREFVLFFGENLQYYITEERAGKEMLTESDEVSISDTGMSSVESRYSMINDMVVSKAVRDEDTLQKLMEEYVEADSFSRKVFKLR